MPTRIKLLDNNFFLMTVLACATVLIVILNGLFGTIVNVGIIGIILFLFAFYVSYLYPKYNIIFLLGCNFLIPFLIKALWLYDIPVGLANEGICFILLLTLLLNGKLSGIKTLPAMVIIIWVCYQFLQLANPNAASRIAGFWAIRGLIPMVFTYFIVYSSVGSKRDSYFLFLGWFIFALLAGLYGIYQELGGLPSYDYQWAIYDENRYNLLFTWGRLRKFSFFFSPSEFGLIAALTGVSAFIIFFFIKGTAVRLFCLLTSVVCLWAMIYTGSRTSMVIVPVGLGIFAAITLNRKVLIGVGVCVLMGSIMLMNPRSGALFVMSTAFSGTDDPSMNLRLQNQRMIRSFIKESPIGFGLGSTGELGMKYSPHTFIGSFNQADSEYVKIALEVGWVGLFLWCCILALLFGYGVTVYFNCIDDDWKNILLVPLVMFFMLVVAQYPQEIFKSQVLTILFSSMIALIAKVNYFNDLLKPIEEL
jgi:putative inorganic carbon (hco3(-)) transporter